MKTLLYTAMHSLITVPDRSQLMLKEQAKEYDRKAEQAKELWARVRNAPYREAILNFMGRECELCGGWKQDSLQDVNIHHIDGDRSHNTMDNFLIVCYDCHWKIHTPTINRHSEWTDKLVDRDEILKLRYKAYEERAQRIRDKITVFV